MASKGMSLATHANTTVINQGKLWPKSVKTRIGILIVIKVFICLSNASYNTLNAVIAYSTYGLILIKAR